MNECFQLLPACISVVAVALAAFSPTSFELQSNGNEHLQGADHLQLLEFQFELLQPVHLSFRHTSRISLAHGLEVEKYAFHKQFP